MVAEVLTWILKKSFSLNIAEARAGRWRTACFKGLRCSYRARFACPGWSASFVFPAGFAVTAGAVQRGAVANSCVAECFARLSCRSKIP